MVNRNLFILSVGQIFSFTSPVVSVLLSGIIGSSMTDINYLATLPTALMIVGTAFGSLIASKIMKMKGRKFGFSLASIINSLFSLFCAYAILIDNFNLFCLGNFIIGLSVAFAQQYRFAATESVEKSNIPKAISLILLLGIVASLLGANIVSVTKDFHYTTYVGSYIAMSLLTIIPFFFLPRTKEEYSWSYIETFKYFFHPYNQRMEIAYMSKGLVDVVQAVFWPIFIFSILDEKFQAVGLITAGVLLVGLILRLFIGGLLDKFHKTKLVKIGIGLNATAWLLKIGVVSALQVFLVSTYHTLALVVLGTSVDTLVYEKAADRGHYTDEYTMIKEMAINLGRVLGLMFIAVLLLFLPLQVSFFVAAFIVLFISWLK